MKDSLIANEGVQRTEAVRVWCDPGEEVGEMEGNDVNKAQLDVLNCLLCKKALVEPTTITECLHTFCKKCIHQRVRDGVESEDNSCPECNIQLGHHPMEKLRPDKLLTEVLEKLNIGPKKECAEDNEEDELYQEAMNEFYNWASADAVDVWKLKIGARGHVNAAVKKAESLEKQLALLQRNVGSSVEFLEAGLNELSEVVSEDVPGMKDMVEGLKRLYAAEKIRNNVKNVSSVKEQQKVGRGKRKRVMENGVGADEEDVSDGYEGNYVEMMSQRDYEIEHLKNGAVGTKKRFRTVEEDAIKQQEFGNADARVDRRLSKPDGFRKEKRLLELDVNEDTGRKEHPTKAPSRVLAAMAQARAVVGTAVSFGMEVLRDAKDDPLGTDGRELPVQGRPPLVKGAAGCGPPHAPLGWGWMVGQRRKGNNHRDVYFWPPGSTVMQNPVRTMRGLRQYFAETIPGLTEEKVKELVAEFTKRYWLCPWLRGAAGGNGAASGPEASDLGSDDETTIDAGAGPLDRQRAEKRRHAFENGGLVGHAETPRHKQRPGHPLSGGALSSPSGILIPSGETRSHPRAKSMLRRSPHEAMDTDTYENVNEQRCTPGGGANGADDSFHSDSGEHARANQGRQVPAASPIRQLPMRARSESARVAYDFVSPALQSGRTALIRQSYAHNLYANLPHRAEALDLPDAEPASPAAHPHHSTKSAGATAGEGGNLSTSPTSRTSSQNVPLRAMPAASLNSNPAADVEAGGGAAASNGRRTLMWLGARDALEAGHRGLPQTEELLPSSSVRSNYGGTGSGAGFPVARGSRLSPSLGGLDEQQQHAAPDRMRASQPPVSSRYASPGRRADRDHYQSMGGSGEGVLSSAPLNIWGGDKEEGLKLGAGGDRNVFHQQGGLVGADNAKQTVQERPANQPVTLFGSVISAGAQTAPTPLPVTGSGQGHGSGGSQGGLALENKMSMSAPSLARVPSPSPRAANCETLRSRASLSPEICHQNRRVSPLPEIKKVPTAADVGS